MDFPSPRGGEFGDTLPVHPSRERIYRRVIARIQETDTSLWAISPNALLIIYSNAGWRPMLLLDNAIRLKHDTDL